MALADDLRTLADRSLTALRFGHDYYVLTTVVWRLANQAVRHGRRFTIRNKITGTVADQNELIGRTQTYLSDYLAPFTFQQFVSQFEDFLFGLVGLWLTAHPQSLAAKTIPFKTVLDASDKAAITDAVVDKELNGLKYERVTDWFTYLDKLVHLDCPSVDEIAALAEIKASRDILVHNKGIVNAVYVAKAGTRARFAVDDLLEIPEHYHRASWDLVGKVIRDVSAAAIAKA